MGTLDLVLAHRGTILLPALMVDQYCLCGDLTSCYFLRDMTTILSLAAGYYIRNPPLPYIKTLNGSDPPFSNPPRMDFRTARRYSPKRLPLWLMKSSYNLYLESATVFANPKHRLRFLKYIHQHKHTRDVSNRTYSGILVLESCSIICNRRINSGMNTCLTRTSSRRCLPPS